MLYSHLQHHNDTIIKQTQGQRHKKKGCRNEGRRKEDAMTKMQEDFFNNIFTSHFIARVRKGCSRFAYERVLETEHKLHILTPLLWLSRCVFLVLLMLGSTPWGLPRAPSVGCGLPYHIWSLLSGTLLATASGVSEVPLGRVWPSLPHLISNSLGVCWQLLWDPNSTELNNNSTPTWSPTGSLNRMFNRHQAEITVMQFRGYSLPVHDCNGTMGPSPCQKS